MHMSLQVPGQGVRRRVMMTPALKPPSRAETDAWLAHERAGQAPLGKTDAQSSEAEGSGFVMDPNTGKLVRASLSDTYAGSMPNCCPLLSSQTGHSC